MGIAAWIFGAGAMIALFLIYQQKTRKGMLTAKLSADVFWVLHYFCLGGIAGMIPNFTGIFRELVFLQRKNKKWAASILWPIFFISLNLLLGLLSFSSPFDLLPLLGSAAVTAALWVDRPTLTKLISLPVSAAFLVYDIHVGSQIGIVNEALSMLSIFIFFFKTWRTKK